MNVEIETTWNYVYALMNKSIRSWIRKNHLNFNQANKFFNIIHYMSTVSKIEK